MLALYRRVDKGKGVGWDCLLIAIIAWRDWLPSCPPALGKSLPSSLPPLPSAPVSGPPQLRLAGRRQLALPDTSSFTAQSPSDIERPFGCGFDMIKHSPFPKVLLAVCFRDDL